MLETLMTDVRAGVSNLAAQVQQTTERLRLERDLPTGKKNRKSTGGASSRGGGALAEALRARGGTKNLDTVMAHASAASDTEAFAPKRRSSGGQGKKRLGRAATTDDDLGDRPSSQAGLGWLDLQAYAPRALQRQLERLADSVDGPLIARTDDDAPSAHQGMAELLAGFGSSGGATSSTTPRGGPPINPLLANLQKRGGLGKNAKGEAEPQLEPFLEQRRGLNEMDADHEEAENCEETPAPLPSVPEEEECEALSPSLAVHRLPETSLKDEEEESSDRLAPPLASHEGGEEEPNPESTDASVGDSALALPPVPSREEEGSLPVSGDSVDESTTNSCGQVRIDTSPSEPSLEVNSDLPVLASTDIEIKASAKPEPVVIPGRQKDLKELEKTFAEKIKALETKSVSRQAIDSLDLEPKPKATESKRPVVAQWHPIVEGIAKPMPAVAPNGLTEEKAAEKEAKDRKKFSDVHNFWKNNSLRFSGPAVGNKGISQVEAQAALQRLLSNSSAVDFNEIRRLRKLSENK